MKFELERCLQIIHGLTINFHALGATDYHIDFTPHTKADTVIVIRSHIKDLEPEVIESIQSELTQTRHPEMEEMFWSISSDTASSRELTTIAIMLDKVEVTYDDEFLQIKAYRHN